MASSSSLKRKPLNIGEKGSFANKTFRVRIPDVIQRVITTNAERYSNSILERLRAFREEIIVGGSISKPLFMDHDEQDLSVLHEWLQVWSSLAENDGTWLSAPWFKAEAYLYRRILEICEYFDPKSKFHAKDPFLPQKMTSLTEDDNLWARVRTVLRHSASLELDAAFACVFSGSLWANRADLCYKEVNDAQSQSSATAHPMVVDDTKRLFDVWTKKWVPGVLTGAPKSSSSSSDEQLEEAQKALEKLSVDERKQREEEKKCVAFVADNCGAEYLMDLVLADFLLTRGFCEKVTMHLKKHPTCVSDTTVRDHEIHLEMLACVASGRSPSSSMPRGTDGDPPSSSSAPRYKEEAPIDGAEYFAAFHRRLTSHLENKRLIVQDHEFWNSARFFDSLPGDLVGELSKSFLIVCKGDANYRRVIYDTRWPTTKPFSELACDAFPSNFVCLRTLKSDGVVGLASEDMESILDAEDSEWRVNGRRGLIQMHEADK